MSEQTKTTDLTRLCDAFRARLRRLLARTGAARALTAAAAMFVAAAVLDWRLHLETPVRLALLAGWVAVVSAICWYTWLRPARNRWTDPEVLAYLDAAAPGGRGMLLDLYELQSAREQIAETQTERGRQLADAALADLQPLTEKVHVGAALEKRSANRRLAVAGAAVAVLGVAAALMPTYAAIAGQRVFNPFSRVRWPHRTTIALAEPATGWTVPQLEPFTVRAYVGGDVPAGVTLAYRTADGPWVRERLPVTDGWVPEVGWENTGDSGTVVYTFPEVRDAIEFTLEGGDFRTDPQEIAVVRRPFLKGITANYSYPEYAGLPDRSVAGGQLAGLEGTRVRLDFESSMPLQRAVFVLTDEAGETRSDLTAVSDTAFTTSLMLARNGRYSVELYEKTGYREAKPEAYEIRVTPDDPPEIEILAPALDLAETRQATVEVAFRARDKLGLSRVQFLLQIDDGPATPLTDRITGPIGQTGNQSSARFTWELRKLDLPESGNLTWFVRAADNNPTGRGRVESPRGRIKLVKPGEFHLEAIERAKLLEEEARIAWRNQLLAWRLAGQWSAKGTGAEDDPLWTQMQDAQQKALAAGRQIGFHLRTLTEKYERNHMADDFMAGRLSAISELLTRLTEQEHAAVAEGLARAKPKTASDAAADRLKSLRAGVLSDIHPRQKMAVLILERLLRKLYDWRDLQHCTLTTRLLHEQQEEVLDRTAKIAPKTIAKEIEDLSDADQEKLLTLGKQQRAVFDTETALESQMAYLMYKAERQGRKTILEPLSAAFGNLRNNRVNHHLKRSAEMIENNQPAQIIDDQKAAMRALKVVQAGLAAVGRKVDPDEPLTAAMTPVDESQFDPDLIKPQETKPDPMVAEVRPPDAPETTPDLPTLPEGTDALSSAVRLALELQDNVLARTRYLAGNRGEAETPRFVRLKLLRLAERQDAALAGIERAIQEADKGAPAVKQMLGSVRDEFAQSRTLLSADQTGPVVQQIQADAIETLKGVLQHIALSRAVEDVTAENRRLNGEDAFHRKYLLRGKDLDTAAAVVADLDFARRMQEDVVRKLERFARLPADASAAEIEKANRTRAATAQKQVAGLLDGIAAKASSFSPEVAERVSQTGATGLATLKTGPVADAILAGKTDAELVPRLREGAAAMGAAVQSLRDLLEERVRPETKAVVVAVAPKLTVEQYNKLTSREHIAELLKNEQSLPPEIRDLMVRSLAKDFPEKYRHLLAAYFASFVKQEKAQEK